MYNVRPMEFNNKELAESFSPGYTETFHTSFEEVVDAIYMEEEKERVILCDIDGVLLGNADKMLGYALLNRSKIPDDIQSHLWFLREELGDRLMIVTNRDPNLNLFLSSKYVIEKTEEIRDPNGPELKIFHSLYKQFPFIPSKSKREVIEYLGEILLGVNDVTITSIEDWSIVSLNRKTYLVALANELYRKFGIRSNVENYVIKK